MDLPAATVSVVASQLGRRAVVSHKAADYICSCRAWVCWRLCHNLLLLLAVQEIRPQDRVHPSGPMARVMQARRQGGC
jgi:hypothetical protein